MSSVFNSCFCLQIIMDTLPVTLFQDELIWKPTRDYKKPARVDDHLRIVTTYDRIKGARLWVSQACYRGDDLLVTAVSEAACITPEGRPKRAPKFMIEGLSEYLLDN